MGRALIQSGGPDGRYTIQVDYGSAQRAALLASFNKLINRYNADIIGQQADVDVVNGMLQDQIVRINQARDGVMPEGFPDLAKPPANKPPGSPIDKQLQQLVITSILNGTNTLRANLRRYTLNIEKMKMERADALKKVATLTTAQATVTKEAWCCTYTETATAGAQVATVDINGESDLTLIAPMARPWAPADGVMTMPHVMSPEQSYFNTAILPGWQKHRPRYRWGTITALDVDADTASVSLAPATSSAQRLDINLFSTLSNIPVKYLSCDAEAFEIGDRCVVEFKPGALPGSLDATVIGFLDNPKPCTPLPDIHITGTVVTAARPQGAMAEAIKVSSSPTPPNQLTSRRPIYTFPAGSITVSVTGVAFKPGETVPLNATINYAPPTSPVYVVNIPASSHTLASDRELFSWSTQPPRVALLSRDVARTPLTGYIYVMDGGGFVVVDTVNGFSDPGTITESTQHYPVNQLFNIPEISVTRGSRTLYFDPVSWSLSFGNFQIVYRQRT
jgi:hypothetical protein